MGHEETSAGRFLDRAKKKEKLKNLWIRVERRLIRGMPIRRWD